MSDFREMNKGKLETEVHEFLRLYEKGLISHDYLLLAQSEVILNKLVDFACNIGAITDSEKEELVKKINKEKEKIKEEFKYGCK